jgi:hypothetical protein
MLVFVDESGDLGFKLDRGSSRFFTIALVLFEDAAAALACELAIQTLRYELRLSPRQEFHFTHDDHERRLAFLRAVAPHAFMCASFTIRKVEILSGASGRAAAPMNQLATYGTALRAVAPLLEEAVVTVDGTGHKAFQQQLGNVLRRGLNTTERQHIREVRVRRSFTDPLLQLADYIAGTVNRLHEDKPGAETYGRFLREKWRGQHVWP